MAYYYHERAPPPPTATLRHQRRRPSNDFVGSQLLPLLAAPAVTAVVSLGGGAGGRRRRPGFPVPFTPGLMVTNLMMLMMVLMTTSPSAAAFGLAGPVLSSSQSNRPRMAAVSPPSSSSDGHVASPAKIVPCGRMKLDPPLKLFPSPRPSPATWWESGSGVSSSLQLGGAAVAAAAAPGGALVVPTHHQTPLLPVVLHHAPLSDFAVHLLAPKGPRVGADVGSPHDSTRTLARDVDGTVSAGSWWCGPFGGWPSRTPRLTTEAFYVLSGFGCVTDRDDGQRHFFGRGDTVVLPRGWSGRWDIAEPIHKIWFVIDHQNDAPTPGVSPIRASVTHYNDLVSPDRLDGPATVRPDALGGTSPRTATQTLYESSGSSSVSVGYWSCTPGSFGGTMIPRTTTECFHVLEGVFFLTPKNSSSDGGGGTAQRCVAGDTVILPKGWSGRWDVVETVRKVWAVVE